MSECSGLATKEIPTIHGANLLPALMRGPYRKNKKGLGLRRSPIKPKSVHAQLIPSLENIWTVKRGKAAATAERIMVFAANADALYIMYVSTKYDWWAR